FLVLLTLLGSLVAMTLVDAKTFTIPLPIMWVPAVAAVCIHPIHAAVVGRLPRVAADWIWGIPTPNQGNWPAICASIGGVVGLGLANLFLWAKLIRPSFADYAEWEASHMAAQPNTDAAVTPGEPAVVTTEPRSVTSTSGTAAEGNPQLW